MAKTKTNYCDQFVSAKKVDKKADKDICAHVLTAEGSCNGKNCCIGCPEIMTGCNTCCAPAKTKWDADMTAHEETMARCGATTEAALEVVAMEEKREDVALTDQAGREARIAEVNQVVGRIQGVRMLVEFGNVSNLMWLKDVKKEAIYKDIPNLDTWEKFCKKTTGYSARHIDDQLKNLEELGFKFLETVSDLRVGYRDLRKLRQLSGDGVLQITDSTIRIGDEEISLDDKEDLAAAIEKVIEKKDAEIEEQATSLKTKDRLIQSKEELLNKMEREIARLEKNVDLTDLSPEEQRQMDILSKIQSDFQKGIETICKEVPFDKASPVIQRSMYFLYIFMSKVAMEERMDLAGIYADAEEVPWEILDEEIPPADAMVDALPLTRGSGMGAAMRGKFGEASN